MCPPQNDVFLYRLNGLQVSIDHVQFIRNGTVLKETNDKNKGTKVRFKEFVSFLAPHNFSIPNKRCGAKAICTQTAQMYTNGIILLVRMYPISFVIYVILIPLHFSSYICAFSHVVNTLFLPSLIFRHIFE